MPPRTLGEEGVASVKFNPRLIVGAMAAVARYAEVAGRDTLNRPVVSVEDFRGRKAREDLNPQLLGLSREPAAQIAQAQRVGALVAHERRHHPLGEAELAALRKDPVMVLRHRNGERRSLVL